MSTYHLVLGIEEATDMSTYYEPCGISKPLELSNSAIESKQATETHTSVSMAVM